MATDNKQVVMQNTDVEQTNVLRVELDRVTKYYGVNLILDDVSLEVAQHEVVCLIGASGSGKSTILKCINDLVPFDYGEIRIDGVSIHDTQFDKRNLYKRIGIVFQAYNLFPHMTVLENITLAPRRVHKQSTESSREYGLELLHVFGLEDFSASYPEQLSGGQQQRVAIIRAMANKPDVLLLDEVTAALDPELIGDVLAVIRNLKDQGMTMIIVTHEMGFARDVADRICFLDDGRILEDSSPDKLLTKPEHTRTKQFLQRITEAGRL